MKKFGMIASLWLTAAPALVGCLIVGAGSTDSADSTIAQPIPIVEVAESAQDEPEYPVVEIPAEVVAMDPVQVVGAAPEHRVPEPVLYDIPLPDELQLYTIEVCGRYGIAPEVAYGIMWRESRYTVDIMGDQGKAYGLMQIRPDWQYDRMDKLGVTDLLDPYSNILIGVDLLAELSEDYEISEALQYYRYGSADATGGYAAEVLDYIGQMEVK